MDVLEPLELPKPMSGYILLGLFVVLMFFVWFGSIRDAYDQERAKIDPEYPRYHATIRQTFRWWWRR